MILPLLAFSAYLHTTPVKPIEQRSVIVWGTDIDPLTGEDEIFICSGVIVTGNKTSEKVLTAGHCADGAEKIQFFDGDEGKIIRVYKFKYDDAALFEVRSKRNKSIVTKIGSPPPRGEHLFIFGNPNDLTWALQNASSEQGPQYTLIQGWPKTYSIECYACGPGDSGAGVWDSEGRLLGIVVAGDGHTTLMVPIARLNGRIQSTRSR